jgi:hypothetical protein
LVFDPVEASPKIFDSFDPNNIDNISLMFQTGYLTVKKITPTGEMPQYTLGVPNQEVRISLLEYLVSLFSYYPLARVEPLVRTMGKQLRSLDADGFVQSVRTMLENIPYIIQIGNEKYCHSLFLSWMNVLGFKAHGGGHDRQWPHRRRTGTARYHRGLRTEIPFKNENGHPASPCHEANSR